QQYLLSDSDGEEPVVPADAGVNEVRLQDKGSRPQSVRVVVAGVPVEGIVDTAADITIVGAEVFKRIAVVAKLRKRELKPADKTPRTYDHKIFRLDGRLDLDVTFQGKTMKTPIYLKMDAKESLLLSEGVCRQLGIVSYHPQVTPGGNHSKEKITSDVLVPAVRVQLVETVKLKPRESIMAGVSGQGQWSEPEFMLLETDDQQEVEAGARIASALVKPVSRWCGSGTHLQLSLAHP
ncbi:hypothetical protein GBAR_LOCUS25737, partial [Geodia barretti]